jgi:hypothetical protein
MLLELAQKRDGSDSSPVETEGKSSSDCDEPNQPVLAGRQIERRHGGDAGAFGQNADEADYIRAARQYNRPSGHSGRCLVVAHAPALSTRLQPLFSFFVSGSVMRLLSFRWFSLVHL